MKIISSKFTTMLLAAAVLSTTMVSCGKKKTEQPELPPSNTFVMEFDDFGGKSIFTEQGSKLPADYLEKAGSNWNHAGVNVLVWNTVIWVGTIVPTLAFLESFNHDPKWKRSEEKWLWAYDYFILGVRHSAELYGWYEDGIIHWEMYVSKEDDFQDVLWFTGLTDGDGNHGTWVIQRNPDNPEPYVAIDWTKNSDGTANISYTNVIPGAAENGGFIEFGTSTGTYNRFYNIYNKGQDNMTYIEWHEANQVGHVSDFNKFGDTDWHCWDAALENEICQ